MVFQKEPVVLPQRIMACDGLSLNWKLNGWLKAPTTREITIVVYRYHDLDFNSGRISSNAQSGLINDLVKAANRGVKLTFVTRDPLTDRVDRMNVRGISEWYKGLKRLALIDGTRVLIHNSLHAKVYLAKQVNDKFFYAVGSSNLTYQGMGFRWSECNVVGYTQSEYQEVEKQVGRIINGREALDLFAWKLRLSKNIANIDFLASLE
jgi:phosphatidylserine/phosphatidylglycerophosphate/cardiolipin synthase-like enzyme